MRTYRTIKLTALLVSFLTASILAAAADVTLPRKPESVKFSVIGDTGTGDSNQYRVAKVLASTRQGFPYEFVLMVGDNVYGSDTARGFEKKFEIPYKTILEAGVTFYAALGNHDSPSQRLYKPFNMNGQRFYTFKPRNGVRFFALDSNYMDREQLARLEKELKASGSDWKIAFFHHPLYSSGERHGSDTALKDQLEPLFVKYSVDLVLTGHDHLYERTKPQKGIQYFVVGNSAKLRKGDLEDIGITAKGFDTGYGFMLANAPADAPPDTVTIPKKPQK
jgi:predicted phosphodiesterase